MKEFKLCGLGNALVDIFLEISEQEFASLGFERGGEQLVDLAEQKQLLERYQKNEPKLVSGQDNPRRAQVRIWRCRAVSPARTKRDRWKVASLMSDSPSRTGSAFRK